jgi:outer membrane protein assembly factor BamC
MPSFRVVSSRTQGLRTVVRVRVGVVVAAASVVLMGACSSIETTLAGEKVDYRSGSSRPASLEVPPDLTQLNRDARFAPQQSGSVSASTFQTGAAAPSAASTTPVVAPATLGDFRLMRNGNQRWLVTPVSAETLWPQLRTFWQERGFTTVVDNPQAGILETDWAENRAKLPDDIVRRTLGKLFDSFYSTGERDKFRMRVERNTAANGTEIYLTHFGLVEELVGQTKDRTVWTGRPNDPQLEAEFLQRLLVKLGTKPEDANKILSAGGTPTGARARVLESQPTATLQVDENFDRAWRRVGTALDRNGFTVEDRDRSAGTYFVRYADPRNTGRDDPNFFVRLFGNVPIDANAPGRYRIAVKADGDKTQVVVLSAQGAAVVDEVGKRIVGLLVEELR